MPRVFAAALLYLAVLAVCARLGWGLAQLQADRSRLSPSSAAPQLAAPQLAAPEVPAAPKSPELAPAPLPRIPAASAGAVQPSRPLAEAAPPLAPPTRPSVEDRQGPSLPAQPSVPPPSTEPFAGDGQPNPSLPGAAPPERPAPLRTAGAALKNGVLIVISLPSQRAFVFKNGELWDSSQVSTGKAGKRTPAGTFTILEKQVHHRSRTYDDAPMPYMQRLTWGGVALHAGHVPGYPASHGCIRLPTGFAKRLYRITNFDSTVVVVTNKRVRNSDQARKLS